MHSPFLQCTTWPRFISKKLKESKLEKAEAVLSECLEWRMKILGSLDSETLRTMERLATVYAKMNMTEKAESFYLRTIDLFEDQYGSNHVDGLTYSTSLVNLYRDSKQTEKAIKLCEEITPKYRSLLGDANPTTQESMKTLALYNDVGEYDKAPSLFQDILASVAKSGGIDTRTSLAVMSYLADTLQSQGQLEQSLEMYKDCWARTRVLVGDNHKDTISAVHRNGLSYYYLGKYEESLPYLLGSCEKNGQLLGKTHEDTLTGMSVTGAILLKLGRYEEAETVLLECLNGRRESLGAAHPSTLSTMNVLGGAYVEKMNRPQDALNILVDVYKGRLKLFGQENQATITTTALLLQALDKIPKKANEKTEGVISNEHEQGANLYQEGKRKEAAELMKQYLAEIPQEFENDEASHLTVGDVSLNKYDQGMNLYREGKREEAVELMKQYLAENPQGFENDEISHLGRFATTGIVLGQIGNLDESESMLTEAVRLWRIVVERETMESLDASFLNSFNSLGAVKSSLGKRVLAEGDRETARIKFAESEALYIEAYEGRLKLLGEDALAS
ncbi:hypothetical protein HDU81_000909 [Chytriomyces hyalinus]|nr:hypothetical protein HDU81_000909 [Chytriomyces hyalinus]